MTLSSSGVTLSQFARGLTAETAFDVLAVARRLKAAGKDVIELQIGDSPFDSTRHALQGGIRAIENRATHYCPSLGLPSFRETVAHNYSREFGVPITSEHVVVGPGAKVFEQFFCEAVLDPGDAVLVFSPHFPTYPPNIERRGARAVYVPLRQENAFRPDLNAVEDFIKRMPRAKAIFLNSPHNPTGGVATAEDVRALADLVRGKNIAVFSDEPYCHMVWSGKHHTPLAEPGMLDQAVACYTFSKSYSMSGWRLGYAITNPKWADTIGKMVNTALSCVPPLVQLAGQEALQHDAAERDEVMQRFRKKVELLVEDLRTVDGVNVLMPAGTFYVFPDVSAICKRLGITSHGLAMFLLEAADDKRGVACLGGECFGPPGQGFLRFSCAEPDERLHQAVMFLKEAVTRTERVNRYLEQHPKYRLPRSAQ
jgi:aspartate aminotransferase